MADTEQSDLTTLTVALLSAYFSNNTVDSTHLAGLIQSTHSALRTIDAPAPIETDEPEHVPAVSVRKSLASSEHLISLIDGKPYKMLKRHLGTHGLTPTEYRARYGLPASYPMVAKDYSEARRAVAEKLGLGRKTANAVAADVAADATPNDPLPSAPVASPTKPSPSRKRAAKPAAAASVESKAKPTRRVKEAAPETAPVGAEVDAAVTAAPTVRKTRAAAKTAAAPVAVTAPVEAATTTTPKAKAKPKSAKPAPKAAKPAIDAVSVGAEATPGAVPKTRARKTLKIAAG